MNTITDWTILRSFLSVANSGSYSAAAKALNISQPTIGRHIQTLEGALKVDLFKRHTRGYALTQKGRDILPFAQQMQQALAEIELTKPEDTLEGTVRVTASLFISSNILPDIIRGIRQDYPEINLDLVPSDTSENLLFREVDIALRMYKPKQLDLVTKKLGTVEMGVVASKSYLDRKGHPTSPQDFKDHDLIGYDHNDLILQGMQAGGLPATRDWFNVRCDNQAIYWDLVRSGCGIGFGQREVIERDPELKHILPDLNIPPLPLWLTTHDALHKTPRIRAVWTALENGLKPFVS